MLSFLCHCLEGLWEGGKGGEDGVKGRKASGFGVWCPVISGGQLTYFGVRARGSALKPGCVGTVSPRGSEVALLHGHLRDPLGPQGDGWLAGGLLAFSEVFADGVQVVVELPGAGVSPLRRETILASPAQSATSDSSMGGTRASTPTGGTAFPEAPA